MIIVKRKRNEVKKLTEGHNVKSATTIHTSAYTGSRN